MIKAEIVSALAARLNIKDREALAIVDAIVDQFKQTIADDGRLEIRDFGVFQVKTRKARIGRNPRDKKEYPIPERQVVTFKPGKILRDNSTAIAERNQGKS